MVISGRKKCHQTTPLRVSCMVLWDRSQLNAVLQELSVGRLPLRIYDENEADEPLEEASAGWNIRRGWTVPVE